MNTPALLEIGDYRYFKQTTPGTTTLLWTGWRPYPAADRSGVVDCTPAAFMRAMRDLHAGAYDLVVAHLPLAPAWLPRYGVRAIAQTPLHPYRAATRVWGVAWLRRVSIPVPLVAMDMGDHFGMGRHNFFMLDKADLVFKRELPADRWQMLAHSAHRALPTLRIRRNPRWQRRLEKVRPMMLPAAVIDTDGMWDGEFPEKTADLFFCGNATDNSWVRRTGLAEVRMLEAMGIRVDIPHERLPHAEFCRRMSKAWLAWSPAGFGWECDRTAEAAQCLAVPVLSYPTIERHCPLLQDTHAFHYGVEPGGLARVVRAALADKDRLRRMALAAREHVLEHHTHAALVRHVIDAGLAAAAERTAARSATARPQRP